MDKRGKKLIFVCISFFFFGAINILLCVQLSVNELAMSYEKEKSKLSEMMPETSMSGATGKPCLCFFFFAVETTHLCQKLVL
jgi:hypothetical protein